MHTYENNAKVVDGARSYQEEQETDYEKELVSFVVNHTDRWRTHRDQNYIDDWERYERIFRGKWEASDKARDSERSRIISPATQQAIETRHAEVMEAIFGQGEFFDIKDDIVDTTGAIDIEELKNRLYEDFSRDKVRKSIDQIELMAEIYGTGIGEIVIGEEKEYTPSTQPMQDGTFAYGVTEKNRVFVGLVPVNPKNFLFDPNGTSIDDCMGVAIERNVSIHKIAAGIASGKYRNVDIGATQKEEYDQNKEQSNFKDDKVDLLTYYGLVPREYLDGIEEVENLFPESVDDYTDMVEAVVVIANGNVLLKAEESPYMMKDRPVIAYQDDTVPNRLLGRGTAEKAYNMQVGIDTQMRLHLDSLALTAVPMVALDATRLPRGAKFEVKPGKAFMTNGAPQEIIYPFQFGANNAAAMETSKEFERMLLMATGTLDSQGMVTAGSRDAGGLAPAVAGIIKKYKRTIVNFQEDFLIPFINKAAWRYMQFDPERYPAVDVKFIPTATLGIMAREYEQQQLAFLVQTLGADSPLTPILMNAIVANSSLSNREKILAQLEQMSKPTPEQEQMQQLKQIADVEMIKAQIAKIQSEVNVNQAEAQKTVVEAQLAPDETKAKVLSAISRNLPTGDEEANTEFDRRIKIAELMLREKDIDSNERIAVQQMKNQSTVID